MKSAFQQRRRKATANSGVMASRRESGARMLRTAQSSREHQADDIASGWLRGEKNLARRLEPSPAAGMRVTNSVGEPLPKSLRRSLEDAFGADLSAVRIHRDSAAVSAARMEGALAFASGSHIYFGAGSFDAASDKGRHLIAHEVAHVLQQTGRTGHGSSLHATDINAGGAIQRVDMPDFGDLRQLHAPEIHNDQYDTTVNELREVLKGDEKTQPDRVEAYALKNLPKIKEWPAESESLLYDVLKALGKFETCVKLLERSDYAGAARITTVLSASSIYKLLAAHNGPEAFTAAFTRDKVMKAYLDELLRIIAAFIFQPLGTAIPQLFHRLPDGTFESIDTHLNRLQTNLGDATDLSENEWFEGALEIMNMLDIQRVADFTNYQHQADDRLAAGGLPIERKRFYAAQVIVFGKNVAAGKIKIPGSDDAVTSVFYDELGQRIQSIGKSALDLFDRAQAVGPYPGRLGEDPEHYPADAKLLAAMKRVAAQAGMPQQVLAQAKELFKNSQDGSWPASAQEYGKRVAKLADNAERYSRLALENEQLKTFRLGKQDESVALIWLTTWLYQFARALRKGADDPSLDARLAHQIRMALALENIAEGLEWKAVSEKAHEIAAAEKQSTSQLALVGEWEADKSRMEALAEDVSDQPMRGYEPLRSEDLVLFFQQMYLKSYGEHLTALLPPEAKQDRQFADTLAANASVIGQAAAQTDAAMPWPHRYTLSDSAWAPKEGRDDFGLLLGCHPKTQALLAKFNIPKPTGCVCLEPDIDAETKQACEGPDQELPPASPDGTFALAPIAYKEPLFIWIVPGIDGLIGVLKTIPVLRTLVGSTLDTGETQDSLKPAEWLARLGKYFGGAISEEDKRKLLDAIRERLSADHKAARASLSPILRRGTTIDRRVRARAITTLLTRYTDDHIKNYGSANDAISVIKFFTAVVVPLEDRELQSAALILSVGKSIIAAFHDEGRYDIVTGLFGPLEAALKIANAADAKTQLAPFLESDEITEVLANVASLGEVLDNFKTQRAKVQRRFGFRALAGSSILKSLVYSAEVKLNEPLAAYDGTPYKVVEIRTGFTFHPAYGTPPSPGETGGSSYSPPQLLDEADEKPLEADPADVLLVVEVGKSAKGATKTRIEVKADPADKLSLEILKDLSYAVEMRAFSTGMKELEAIMQKYVELMYDIGELIPGVGQAVTAVRILQTVAEFYQQGGYEAVKTFFSGEMNATLNRFLGDLKDLVSPENLWLLFLFGDERLDNLLAYVDPKSQDNSESNGDDKDSAEEYASKGKFGFVRKAVHALKKVGIAFARLMHKIGKWIEHPMQDLRAYSTTRPILSFVIGFISDHIFDIFALAKTVWEAFHHDQDSPEDKRKSESALKDELTQQQQMLGEKVHGVIQTVQQAKLPEKVVNIDAVVSFIVHKLIVFVGKRLGTKGKVVTFILNESGAIGLISDRIAHELVSAGLDPNVYWRETIKPAVEDRFNEGRDALVGGINSALEPFEGLFTPVPKPAPVSVGFSDGEVEEFKDTHVDEPPPETQPQATADSPVTPATAVPRTGAGMPLPGELRSRFEERFGQDFSHVRLHQGAEAAAMTGAFSANALTTGSHIFLKPGLSPTAGSGEMTMRHELMHVIQQTGARALGEGASSMPVPGAPGRGLVHDPMLERAADEAAKQQPNRNSIRAVEPGAAAHLGMQPALDLRISPFTLGRFFRELSTLQEIKKRQEEIERGKVAEYTQEVPEAGRTAVQNVLAVLADLQGNYPKKVRSANVFSSVVPDISTYLADSKRKGTFQHAAQLIAIEASEKYELPGQAGAKDKKTEQVLQISRFARELEAYVLAATGIGIALDLKSSGKTESGQKQIDGDDTVKELKIIHIHLPWVGEDAPDLWNKAINKTWAASGDLDDKALQQYKGVLLPLLQSKGVVPGVWAFFGDSYEFSLLLKREVNGKLGLTGERLPPDKLPPWSDYVVTDPKVGKSEPQPIGHVGLRLSTYGDDASQSSTGRESHHLTQYLLGDYFSNQNPGAQPFEKNRVWPGVKFSGSGAKRTVIQIENPDDSGNPIKVDATRGSDRGGAMPAISLAAITHQRGRLHVTPEPDDFDHKAKSSQAFSVHNEFRARMPQELFAAGGEIVSRKKFDDFVQEKGKEEVARITYKAAQATYGVMRNYMSKQLKENLVDLEFDYYKGIALGGPHDLTGKEPEQQQFKAALSAIPAAAREHNDKVMRDTLGWDSSK